MSLSKKKEFKNMGQYVQSLKLEEYIEDRKSTEKDLGYGKTFEKYVVNKLYQAGVRIQKTGAEYDYIKGADLRLLFDNASILVDVKLNKEKALHGNLFYVKDCLEFSRSKKDIFYFPLSYGLEVGFTLKNIRRGEKGYCTLKKPVLVAVFNVTAKCKRNPHRLFTLRSAKQLARYIELINLELVRSENYPARDVNSFYFTPYKK